MARSRVLFPSQRTQYALSTAVQHVGVNHRRTHVRVAQHYSPRILLCEKSPAYAILGFGARRREMGQKRTDRLRPQLARVALAIGQG